MKLKKVLIQIVPALTLLFGAATFAVIANHNNKEAVGTFAAEYTISNRDVTSTEGNVSATFTCSDSELNMRGWLLCLFDSKPIFNPASRKLESSNNIHPYTTSNCAHYFYAADTTATGAVSVTWAANAADQKEAWSATETTGAAGHTLADYLALQDWYIVIGPRHYNNEWAKDQDPSNGEGKDGIWENCDYYVGKKSIVLGDLPSGQIYLDLTQFKGWENDDAKFAVHFFKGTTEKGWSEFAAPTGHSDIYVASFELDFVPTNMIGVRLRNDATVPTFDKKDNQGKDETFFEHGVIGVTDWNTTWAGGLATVDCGDRTIVLDHYKRNGKGNSEHYNDYVELKANDEFQIGFNGNSYTTFETHTSLASTFTLVGDKIKVSQGGTYSMYFDTNGSAEKLYITTPALAEADDWALNFLGDGCESNTIPHWGNYGDDFVDMSTDAKNLFLDVEHEPDPNKILTGYVEQAVQRYDYVLTIYGTDNYYDFMGRVKANKVTPKQSNSISIFSDETSVSAVIVVVAIASLLSITGLMFLKKKKSYN